MTNTPGGVARAMQRRQVLLGTGVALSTIVAGCAGEDSQDDGGTASETEETGTDATDGEDGDGDDDEAGTDDGDETETDDNVETEDGDDPEADETDPFDAEPEPPAGDLRITEDELVEDDYSVSVVGLVVNEAGEELRAVEIAVAFYDADGDRVDENSTQLTDMDEEEEASFEVMSVADGIVEYEVVVADAEPAEQTFG